MRFFFSSIQRVLERYDRDLPGLLLTRYGNSPTYTAGQVRRTVETSDLDSAHIEYAFAMFLTKADFDRLYTPGNYTFLRADLLREIAKMTGNDPDEVRDQATPLGNGPIPAIATRFADGPLSDAFE